MHAESVDHLLHCERADAISDHGPVTFLTVLLAAASGGMLRCEHHVFIESTERHLHEITFHLSGPAAPEERLRDAVCHSHQLFADHLARSAPFAAGVINYRTRPLADLPFPAWRASHRFLPALAILPDLTASPQLCAATLAVPTHRRF